MNYFIFASTVLFWIMSSIWNKNNSLNFFLKMIFLGVALWGSYISIHLLNISL